MIRPPLLKLGGEENFTQYQTAFDDLYHTQTFYDVRNCKIVFAPSACWHICYTCNPDSHDGGRRPLWSQERAEQIPYIKEVLQNPTTELRPNKIHNRLTYIARFDAEPLEGIKMAWYSVIIAPISNMEAAFITAYPINRDQFNNYRKMGKALYPKK